MTIIGMPGIGGSLGECQVCGEPFALEILTGDTVAVGSVTGIKQDIAVHQKCVKHMGQDWHLLPDGPLRRFFDLRRFFEEQHEQTDLDTSRGIRQDSP